MEGITVMKLNGFYLTIIAFVLFGRFSMAQIPASQILLPVEINGKWGFIDSSGKIAIEPNFDYAESFSEGLAPFKQIINGKDKFGYINQKAEIVISAKFDSAREFSEGLAVVRINGKDGYINTSGEFVIEPIFERAWSFSNGRGRVLQFVKEKADYLYGFVNTKGQIVIEPQYIFARDFQEDLAGIAVEANKNIKMGFIDKEGKVVIKPKFSIVGNFSEGLAVVAQNAKSYLFEGDILFSEAESKKRKISYINKSGKEIIKGNFQIASDFSEGLARVEIKNKWRFIDKTGKIVIDTDFPESAELGDFSEGLASLNFMNGAKFIDKTGKIVIKTDFNWADNFSNGYARVKKIGKYGSESYGYVDKNGNLIWNPTTN